MRSSYDAIIIGAGVIGTAIGLELARRGLKTFNVERHPAAGYGSTSSSCAIIRCFYSTVAASAFALEGYHYWKNWSEYLGVEDERGLARFRETGCLVLKTEANGKLKALLERMQEAGVAYEEWSRSAIGEKLPFWDLRLYAPPRLPEEAGFGEPDGAEIEGGVFFPQRAMSATRNLQRIICNARRRPPGRSSASTAKSEPFSRMSRARSVELP